MSRASGLGQGKGVQFCAISPNELVWGWNGSQASWAGYIPAGAQSKGGTPAI